MQMPPQDVGVRSSHLKDWKKEGKKVFPSSCQEVCPTKWKKVGLRWEMLPHGGTRTVEGEVGLTHRRVSKKRVIIIIKKKKSHRRPSGPPSTLFWCQDRLFFSLSPSSASIARRWLAKYKKVCQLAKRGEGRKESKTSERIHSVSFLRLCALPLRLPGGSDFASASESISLICAYQMCKYRSRCSAFRSTFCRSVDRLLCFYDYITTDVLVYGPQLLRMLLQILLLSDDLLTCIVPLC